MSETLVPCLICGKKLFTAFEQDSPMQPVHGVICSTHGNYGSGVFDPGWHDDRYLQFIVCDDCLVENKNRVRLVEAVRSKPEYTYSEWDGL